MSKFFINCRDQYRWKLSQLPSRLLHLPLSGLTQWQALQGSAWGSGCQLWFYCFLYLQMVCFLSPQHSLQSDVNEIAKFWGPDPWVGIATTLSVVWLSPQACHFSFLSFKLFIYFLKDFVYLSFIDSRERGREGERKGEKHWWVASHLPPAGDPASNPGTCPDWESSQRPFGLQAGTQSTEPHQPGLKLFINIMIVKMVPTSQTCLSE